jgi:hypothetical protein
LKAYVSELSTNSPGPSEAGVHKAIAELEQTAAAITSGRSDKEVTRLRILAGLDTPDETPSERTIQHWKKELTPRVSRLI